MCIESHDCLCPSKSKRITVHQYETVMPQHVNEMQPDLQTKFWRRGIAPIQPACTYCRQGVFCETRDYTGAFWKNLQIYSCAWLCQKCFKNGKKTARKVYKIQWFLGVEYQSTETFWGRPIEFLIGLILGVQVAKETRRHYDEGAAQVRFERGAAPLAVK